MKNKILHGKNKYLYFIIALALFSNIVIAANDPGHDSLYIEQDGNSELNGTLNITQNISIQGGRSTLSGLNLFGNGVAPTPGNPYISAVTNDLYLDGQGNVYIKYVSGGDTVFVGVTGTSTDLNVSGALYVQSSTLRVNGQNVCLADGTNCPAIGGASSAGGWTNTSTYTQTTLNVNITQNVLVGNLTVRNLTAVSCDVKADTNGVIYCGTDATGSGGDGTGGWTNTSTYTTTNLSLNITNSTGSTLLFVNTSNGRIGIGTNSPIAKASILDSGSLLGGTGYINFASNQDYTNYRGVYLGYDTSSIIGIIGATGTTSSNLAFWTINTTHAERMRLTQDGKLGIGTTTPTSTLQVNGTTNTTFLTIANNTASNCDLKADTNGNVYCGTDASGSGADGTGGWTNTSTYTQTSLNVNITSGNLTMGSGQQSFELYSTGGNTYLNATGTIIFVNNISINKTSNTAQLDVSGTIKATYINTTNLVIGNATAASCDLKATTTGSVYCGTDATGSTNFGNLSSMGSSGYIPFFNNNTQVNNSVAFQNGTFIGIGITTPSTKLHVADTATPVIFLRELAGSGSYGNSLVLDRDNAYSGGTPTNEDGVGLTFRLKNSSGTLRTVAVIVGQINNVNDSAGSLAFHTKSSADLIAVERMRLNGSGSLGINTINPKALLDVNGTANITYLTIASATAASCDLKAHQNGTVYCGTDATGSGGDGTGSWLNTTTYTTTTLNLNVTNSSNGALITTDRAANTVNLGEGTLFVNKTLGAVGIGTTNPNQYYSLSTTNGIYNTGFYIESSSQGIVAGTPNAGALYFRDLATNVAPIINADSVGNIYLNGLHSTNSNITIAAWANDGAVGILSNDTEIVKVVQTGVGIKLTDPKSALHVNGTTNTTYLTIASATAASCDLKAHQNGTVYCGTDATGSGGDGTGGWFNTSTYTTTNLSVNITGTTTLTNLNVTRAIATPSNISIGSGAMSNASGSIAIGHGAKANAGDGSAIVIGQDATTGSDGRNSIVIGKEATTTGIYATSIGYQTNTEQYALALGSGATALSFSTSLGAESDSTNIQSIAIGYGAQATGLASIALGTESAATQAYTIAIGTGIRNTNAYTLQIGNETQGYNGTIHGNFNSTGILSGRFLRISNTTAASCDLKADTNGNVYCGTDATGSGGDGTGGWFNTSTYTTTNLSVNITGTTTLSNLNVTRAIATPTNISIGSGAMANYTGSIAIGDGARAESGEEVSIVIGRNSKSQSTGAGANLIIGSYSNATHSGGYNTFIGNYINNANSRYSVLIGQAAIGGTFNVVGIGYAVNASGFESTAIGLQSQTTARAIAVGGLTYAADEAVALGHAAGANTDGSIAIGKNSYTAGGSTYQIAIGHSANSTNTASISLGYSSLATGSYAIAIGANSNATYQNSIAIGQGARTFATNTLQIGNSTQGYNGTIHGNWNATGIIYTPQICLNGNCQTSWGSGSADGTGGWTNTSTYTTTTLNLNVTNSSNGALITTDRAANTVNLGEGILFINKTLRFAGIGTTEPASLFDISSGTNGDAILTIQADTDNNNENDNPRINFLQDGGQNPGFIAIEGDAGTTSTGTLENHMLIGEELGGNFGVQFITNDIVRATIDNNGLVGIGINTPSQRLHVQGNLNVSGNVFYGGNLTSYGADFAESFIPGEDMEPGDVVCLSDNYVIYKCKEASDNSVAGVVSQRPTIIGNAGLPNSIPVGVVGIVKTKVVGPVEKFELLTTSEVEGHAQKAILGDFGSIIGKAMESCDEGTCEINVLVGLR